MNIPIISTTKLIFIFNFLFIIHFCLGSNIITTNEHLNWNQTLVSPNGIFELGFFKPGKTSKYYVGMWYKQVPEIDRVVLWVANREKPITDKYSTHLKVSYGNLVLITNESKTPIWSTNLSFSNVSESLEAVLLDNGDFVFRQRSNLENPLWQSSYNPSHVWLPGYKLGLDKRTGTNKVLTSWKNSEDPALGLFSYQLFDNGSINLALLWNETEEYWNSGEWDPSEQIFSLLPQMWKAMPVPYNMTVIDNEYGRFFTNYMDYSYLHTFLLDISGQLKSSAWKDSDEEWVLHCSLPVGQCDVHHACGPFSVCNGKYIPHCYCLDGFQPRVESDWNLNDYSSGCSRIKPLQCVDSSSRKGRDGFRANTNMVLPDNSYYVEIGNKQDCELTCLKNCSCTAYAYESTVCSIWIGDLFSVKQLSDGDLNGKTLYVRLNALDIQSKGDKKRLVITITSSILGLSAFITIVVYLIMPRRKNRLWDEGMLNDVSLVQFRFKQLKNATENFSEKLGKGSFGTVYKGRLSNSSFIAVKMLEGASQGEKQFRTEVSIIGKIQHVNVVRLSGFCSQGNKRLLVYEYMPNGSLDTLLFPKNCKFLRWKTRYQIAVGVAKGLAYLHENCIDYIIHCDIKPENILLDADFCPKVADFGLAKLMHREYSRVLTTMRGTRGYLAPELISGEGLTTKADVYSYGMMLFEFISCSRNTQYNEDDEIDYFPMRAISKIIKGEDLLSIVDDRVRECTDREAATRLCKLAGWCIQEGDNQRPTMRQVVQVLEGVSDVEMPPMPWFFNIFEDGHSKHTINRTMNFDL